MNSLNHTAPSHQHKTTLRAVDNASVQRSFSRLIASNQSTHRTNLSASNSHAPSNFPVTPNNLPAITPLIPGCVGRLAVNNLTKTVSNFQSSGRIIWDLKASTLRSGLIGMSLQTYCNYSMRDRFITDNEPTESAFLKTFAIGACSGLLMHPSSVRFFLSDKLPCPKNSAFPIIKQVSNLAIDQPHLLKRGLNYRLLMSGLDWSIFFSVKHYLREHTELNEKHSSLIASITSNGAVVGLLKRYMAAIKSEGAKPPAQSIPIKVALFSLLVFERWVQDVTHQLCDSLTSEPTIQRQQSRNIDHTGPTF